MNITVEDVAPCKKRLKIEVPANRVQQAYDRVTDDFEKEARIPGFRPGHAPRAVVLKKFQKDIAGETQRTLVPEAYQERRSRKRNCSVVSSPEIEDLEISAGPLARAFPPWSSSRPDFRVAGIQGLHAEKAGNSRARRGRGQDARRISPTSAPRFDDAPERPLAMEDFAVISYTGSLDGKPLHGTRSRDEEPGCRIPSSGSGCGRGFPRRNSPNSSSGLSKGEKRTIEVEFPADFPQDALAGKNGPVRGRIDGDQDQDVRPLYPWRQDVANTRPRRIEDAACARTLGWTRRSQGRPRCAQRDRAEADFFRGIRPARPRPSDEETHAAVYDIVAENQSRGIAANVLEEKKDEIFANAARSARDLVKFKFHRRADRGAGKDRGRQRADRAAPRLSWPSARTPPSTKWSSACARTTPSAPSAARSCNQLVLDFLLKEAKFE